MGPVVLRLSLTVTDLFNQASTPDGSVFRRSVVQVVFVVFRGSAGVKKLLAVPGRLRLVLRILNNSIG
jgi:hypothetical protein